MLPDNQTLKKANIFFAKILVLGLLFSALNTYLPSFSSFQSLHAEIIASLLPISAHGKGIFIVTDTVTYAITRDCLGWKSMFAFASMAASSAEYSQRGYRYVIAAVAAIAGLNVLRIAVTVSLAQRGVPFDLLHDVLWRWGMTAAVFTLWLPWIKPGMSENVKNRLCNTLHL